MSHSPTTSMRLIDDFDGSHLDPERWVPAYLPEWSSRGRARATWRTADSRLMLSIPPDHPIWCEEEHHPPIRVSAIQSGTWSGPVGSARGQQPFHEGLIVLEAQPDFRGWTPQRGTITIRARADLSPRSMFSAWMIGREVDSRECAEICIMEVFGNSRQGDSYEVGAGVHAFRDPDAVEDFTTTRMTIDPGAWHDYSVRWTASNAMFAIDGNVFRTVPDPPQYPMQVEIAVFDFPEWSTGDDDHLVPVLEVDWIRYAP